MGSVLIRSFTLRGRTSRKSSWAAPLESSTRRWMRYHTLAAVSPRSGTVNLPLLTPLVDGTKGCRWLSWWKSTRQVKALSGNVPSSASVPRPS